MEPEITEHLGYDTQSQAFASAWFGGSTRRRSSTAATRPPLPLRCLMFGPAAPG